MCSNKQFFIQNYRFSNIGLQWTAAKESCQSFDSNLFGPRTIEENDAITEKATEIYGSNRIWMGINDFATEGRWVYNADNSEIELSNFNPGEPNGSSVIISIGLHLPYTLPLINGHC